MSEVIKISNVVARECTELDTGLSQFNSVNGFRYLMCLNFKSLP